MGEEPKDAWSWELFALWPLWQTLRLRYLLGLVDHKAVHITSFTFYFILVQPVFFLRKKKERHERTRLLFVPCSGFHHWRVHSEPAEAEGQRASRGLLWHHVQLHLQARPRLVCFKSHQDPVVWRNIELLLHTLCFPVTLNSSELFFFLSLSFSSFIHLSSRCKFQVSEDVQSCGSQLCPGRDQAFSATRGFDLLVDFTDHTGTVQACHLRGLVAEQTLGCTVSTSSKNDNYSECKVASACRGDAYRKLYTAVPLCAHMSRMSGNVVFTASHKCNDLDVVILYLTFKEKFRNIRVIVPAPHLRRAVLSVRSVADRGVPRSDWRSADCAEVEISFGKMQNIREGTVAFDFAL